MLEPFILFPTKGPLDIRAYETPAYGQQPEGTLTCHAATAQHSSNWVQECAQSIESQAASHIARGVSTFTIAFIPLYALIFAEPCGLTLTPGNTVNITCTGNFI